MEVGKVVQTRYTHAMAMSRNVRDRASTTFNILMLGSLLLCLWIRILLEWEDVDVSRPSAQSGAGVLNGSLVSRRSGEVGGMLEGRYFGTSTQSVGSGKSDGKGEVLLHFTK